MSDTINISVQPDSNEEARGDLFFMNWIIIADVIFFKNSFIVLAFDPSYSASIYLHMWIGCSRIISNVRMQNCTLTMNMRCFLSNQLCLYSEFVYTSTVNLTRKQSMHKTWNTLIQLVPVTNKLTCLSCLWSSDQSALNILESFLIIMIHFNS